MPHWAAAPHHHADDPAMAWAAGALGSAIVACGLAGGIWIVRARVQANDAGMRWRGWGPWHIIRWESVTDFFEEPGRHGRTCVIEARSVSVGAAVSELIRRGLEVDRTGTHEDGFPVFRVNPTARPIALEDIKQIEDDC